jgi:very-short-patch-repair endonuclease
MPRHKTSTSFIKGDPRVTGIKRSSESIEKCAAKLRNRIAVNCAHCGNILLRIPYKVAHQNWHFCNAKCWGLWYSKARGILFEWHISEKGMKKLAFIVSANGKRTWANKNEDEKIEWSRNMRRACTKKPTKPEKVLLEIINKHNLPYEYVGNGKFWIEKINPDFVNCNGQKVILEVFGDYWHNLDNVILRDKEKEKILSKYGWQRIIFWEHEVKELPESVLLERLEVTNAISI